MKNKTESLLASYATFKELYKSEKYSSPYQILAEFIRFIILSKSLYEFSTTDIQTQLNTEFGFTTPLAVVRTSMKQIEGVTRDHGRYRVNREEIRSNNSFSTFQRTSTHDSTELVNSLIEFAHKKADDIDEKKLTRELLVFLMDEEGDQEYQEIIGSFAISNENNQKIQDQLSEIREGSVLYSGLTYNISDYGSVKEPLTLFLDTEILFDIIGLNGDLYKILASDFLNLIDIANHNGKVITLKYFDEVKDDVDKFFRGAELVVRGKGDKVLRLAMRSIVTGCADPSDVKDKQTDFYRKLHVEHGITRDSKSNYYTEYDEPYELEAEKIEGFSASSNYDYEGIRYCSHINVLRKGEQNHDYLKSKYLFVTDTHRVLQVSSAFSDKYRNKETGEKYCEYAVNLSAITNILWSKLNRGFGNQEFPQNINAVIKARTVLSGFINQGIFATYSALRKDYASGKITADQAATRIVALREKTVLPESLQADSLETDLSFSEDYFNSYAENISSNKRLLAEREQTITDLTSTVGDLKNQLKQEQDLRIEEKKRYDDLSKIVEGFQERDRQKELAKKRRKALFKLIWNFLWKAVAIMAIYLLTRKVCQFFKWDFGTVLSIVIGIGGLIPMAITFIKKDLKTYKDTIG